MSGVHLGTHGLVGGIRARVVDHREFLLYAIIGVSGVLLDLVVFVVLYNVVGMWEVLATFISTTAGITNNFVLNAFFNFRKKDRLLARFAKFYTVGVVGILLTWAMFAVFSAWLGVDPNLVKVGSLPVVVIVQYGLNRGWTFR